MTRKAKVAITIDAGLLRHLERIRAITGESRSAVIGRAVARLTADDIHNARVRRYSAAYREQPEGRNEVRAASRLARRTLGHLPWEDA